MHDASLSFPKQTTIATSIFVESVILALGYFDTQTSNKFASIKKKKNVVCAENICVLTAAVGRHVFKVGRSYSEPIPKLFTHNVDTYLSYAYSFWLGERNKPFSASIW